MPPQRIRQLDILRGVAVVLVLGRHMGVVPLDAPFVVQSALDLWLRVGWIGVDLFFVLSGYLVSGLLFREFGRLDTVRAGRFLARRGLRIYPAFYVFLIATSIATGALGTKPFVAEATFVQNYIPGLWDHTWSLAVEEHFYFLLALLMAVLVRRRSRATKGADTRLARDPFSVLIPLFATVAGIELALRIATARYGKPWFAHHLYPTHLRLDSLLFGVLLSYLVWSKAGVVTAWVRARRSHLVLLSVVCLTPPCFLPATNPFMETVGFTLLYVGFGAVLILATHEGAKIRVADSGARIPGPPSRDPVLHDVLAMGGRIPALVQRGAGSVLAWIGVYSYSIYLWHLAVKRWVVPVLVHAAGWRDASIAAFLVYIASSLVFGVVLARLIEIPTLALRDQWLPGVATAGATLQQPPADLAA